MNLHPPINTLTLLFQNIFNIQHSSFQSSFQLAVAMADIDRSSDNASADSKGTL